MKNINRFLYNYFFNWFSLKKKLIYYEKNYLIFNLLQKVISINTCIYYQINIELILYIYIVYFFNIIIYKYNNTQYNIIAHKIVYIPKFN